MIKYTSINTNGNQIKSENNSNNNKNIKNLNVITMTATIIIIIIIFSFYKIAGLNGRIEYSITAGDYNNDFVIDKNGAIRTQRALDRESISQYNLVVTAKDSAQEFENRLSSTVQVTLFLLNHNMYQVHCT